MKHSSHVASEWFRRREEESQRCRSRNRYVTAAPLTPPLRAKSICGCYRSSRGSRRDIRKLIFLSMCSRLTFRRDHPTFTHHPHGILGYQRRKIRILHAFTRGIPLRTISDMRDALANFDKVVKCATLRLPRTGATSGAIVTVLAVTIALGVQIIARATEAADTS